MRPEPAALQATSVPTAAPKQAVTAGGGDDWAEF